MKRIVWHWTAGGYTPSATDIKAYHEIIDGEGRVVKGTFPISANKGPITGEDYAKHTGRFNSDAIGISVASMRGAKDRPFSTGPSPMTEKQVEALVKRTAELCKEYGIEVTRENVLSHAEVHITHRVTQAGKWDITWLPGMTSVANAVEVGDSLRERVRAHMNVAPVALPAPAKEAPSWLKALIDLIKGMFRG
jgi:hypothetical protein